MPFEIIDNTNQIVSNLQQRSSIFLRTMADEIVKDAEPNTPKDRGNLRRDIVKSVLGLRGTIIWGKHYAKFQEKKQYRNYTTSGTGPHFAENAVKSAAKRTEQIARKSGLIK